ncbi:NnrU family protein [Paramagnetospirillum magnetotacticum]|nr:NnrU family protein [Paramagnetospirillum magnetotacticum]
MGDVGHLIVSVAAFLGAHSLSNWKPLRAPIEARYGKQGFYLGYSVVSTALLVWVIAAALNSPTVVVWEQQPWMRWVPPLVMPVACLFWVLGLAQPNPFSIGLGGAGYDPARPGIVRLTRHPIIWGLGLWSGAHILPNGHLAGLLLFTPLFLLCLMGARILDAKRRRSLGEAHWRAMADLAIFEPHALLTELGWKRILGGLALYPVLLWLHPMVIGLSPLP